MRRRRQSPRAAAHDFYASVVLYLRRHQPPGARQTFHRVASAFLMPPAEAAPARAPQRQRFRIEQFDRRKRDFPLRPLVIRRPPLPEQPAPARFSLPPFLHASHRFVSQVAPLAPRSPRTRGEGASPLGAKLQGSESLRGPLTLAARSPPLHPAPRRRGGGTIQSARSE
jgi:hypothetical protein